MTVLIVLGMALTGGGLFAWLGVKVASLLQRSLTPEEKRRVKEVFSRRPELPDPIEVGSFEEPSDDVKELVRGSVEDLDPETKRKIMREVREILDREEQPH